MKSVKAGWISAAASASAESVAHARASRPRTATKKRAKPAGTSSCRTAVPGFVTTT